jgi:ELWxxDGT repeat protein
MDFGATIVTTPVAMNGALYFSADDGSHGKELWKSDGTASGTVMLKDINPGSLPSNPTGLTVVGSTLFFSACDGRHGFQLWESDGTAAGTGMVKNSNPWGSYSENLINFNGTLLYSAYGPGTGRDLILD